MKKSIYALTLLMFTLLNCSSDDDSTEQQAGTSYKVEISGRYVDQWCIDPITSKITVRFLEDGDVNSTINGEGSNDEFETFIKNLSGNEVGVKLNLTDYNPSNLEVGEGDAFDKLHLKITNNENQEILIDEDVLAWLVHCNDIYYEVTMMYNISTLELETQTLTN